MTPVAPPTDAELNSARAALDRLVATLQTVLFGQEELIELVVSGVLARGHLLLEGLPGLGKTELVKGLAHALGLTTRRVQFTPDLLPGDITGNPVLDETPNGRRFVFQRGPVFTNILLADEINRASPKTQSALLEAMQEHRVTAGGVTHSLPDPFFVLATQNPIEQEGTYPLPEAQQDRFMFNIKVDYPIEDDECRIIEATTGSMKRAVQRVISGPEILAMQDLVLKIPAAQYVIRYAARLARYTRPKPQPGEADPHPIPDFVKKYVSFGAGPRAGQNLILAAKARAIMTGRAYVALDDVKSVALPVLRHRIMTNYIAEAEGVTPDDLVERLLKLIPRDGEK